MMAAEECVGCRRSWDLGVYVAVTSSHPLKVYVYNDIVLRFCPAMYVDPVNEPEVWAHALPPSFRVRVPGVLVIGDSVQLHGQYVRCIKRWSNNIDEICTAEIYIHAIISKRINKKSRQKYSSNSFGNK